MTIQSLIEKTVEMQGNLLRGNQTYISSNNMKSFALQLGDINSKQGILITPYLIVDNGELYELHYYEFDIEVGEGMSHYVDYSPNNTLPAEITENLKPQIIIAVGDKNAYSNAVSQYVASMANMDFKEDIEHYPKLQNAQLFYQIFINSELS